jgi:hypothetical protein
MVETSARSTTVKPHSDQSFSIRYNYHLFSMIR